MKVEGQILKGDARRLPLADNSVDCIVTSPPYWGQRKYRVPATVWSGRAGCRHQWGHMERGRRKDVLPESESTAGRLGATQASSGHNHGGRFCRDCGAWRGQLGLEPTPQLYIEHLVECFREARRALKPSGTCWLIISDSRPSNKGAGEKLHDGMKQATNRGCQLSHDVGSVPANRQSKIENLKCSDMLGLPHDLVKALRADGWYWRDEIIWAKPNGMCESQRTRTTRNHEYVFLLTKSPSPKYFFDVEAIMEPASDPARRERGRNKTYAPPGQNPHHGTAFVSLGREGRNSRMHQDRDVFHPAARKVRVPNPESRIPELYRRKRSVWWISVSKPRIIGKHYATFPEKLVEPMILAGCPKGGIVLDPFAGSGTTGAVARRLGRRFILIDLAYQEMQRKRLKTVDCQL